jgi:hypothetical protein
MRIMAVDWSGAKRHPERRMWLAEAAGDRLVGLTRGRTREQLTDDLISETKRDPEMIIGLDFAFSFPAWFGREQGCTSAHDVWTAARSGGRTGCAPVRRRFGGGPVAHARRMPERRGSAAPSSTRPASAVLGQKSVFTWLTPDRPCVSKAAKAGTGWVLGTRSGTGW